MTKMEDNNITALVCTRNRGESIVSTVQSILANTHTNFELIIVDQSTDNKTEEAINPFLKDSRIRYIKTDTIGVSCARNLGINAASADIIVFTDDDCHVPALWMKIMENIFKRDSNVAVAFCNVDPGDYDAKDGFIPSYQRKGNLLLTNIKQKTKARGIGAGIAVRRSSILSIGGFDETLGPGRIFPACEDGDIAVRALLKGFYVYETSDVSVTHFGFRKHSEGRELSRRDWVGIGAAYSKPLKCRHWNFAIVPAYEFFVVALGPLIIDLLRFRRPVGITRLISFLKGFGKGLLTPVDANTLKFQTRQIKMNNDTYC